MLNIDIMALVRYYSSWSSPALLITLLLAGFMLLVAEVLLALLLRRAQPIATEHRSGLAAGLLKLLRIALRFGLPSFFLYIIRTGAEPAFPYNLLYHGPLYTLLFCGALGLLYALLDLFVPREKASADEAGSRLVFQRVSRRGIKTVLFFLGFSVLLWRSLMLLPESLQASPLVSAVVIVNGIFILIVLLLIVQRVIASAEKLFDQADNHVWMPLLLQALAVPVRILIVALAMVWLRPLLSGSPQLFNLVGQAVQLLFATALVFFAYRLAELGGRRLSEYSAEESNHLDRTLVEMLRMVLRILILSIALFLAIRIITGKPLTTLLAGLGIGGLAVALAAQDTLKNFFGSIMILVDKPFALGERIQVAEYDGVIEAIGFRSTRIRTLTGHQVVIPNDKMAAASVENIGRRPHIRRLVNIGLTYSTGPEKMELALDIVRKILENHEGMTEDLPPRVHFSDFNADSLNIMILYWYSPPDYWKFMEFSEKVNLAIMREFESNGIEFAFPSTTTYLEQPEGKVLRLDLGAGRQ